MTKRISIKYSFLIMVLIAVVTLVFIPIYSFVQESLYIGIESNHISKFCDNICNDIDISDTDKVEAYLEEFNENNYTVSIYDSSQTQIFSNRRFRRMNGYPNDGYEKKISEHNIAKYSENSKPEYFETDEAGSEHIALRRIVSNNGKKYYIMVRESLSYIESAFGYANNGLILILIAYIVVCGVLLFALMNSLTKSVRNLNKTVKKISEKDYSTRYDGKISKDEIGTLAVNINNMADTIQDNINSISNYNFLLEEDLEHLKRYEALRSKLVRNTTHELKTPLAIISSQVEMMSLTTDEEKRKFYYDSAMEEISKMSTLITGVLKYSVAEDTALKIPPETVDLSRRITELCETVKPTMRSKNLNFSYNVESGLSVTISPPHIEHVFNNYIMNAVKHAAKGGSVRVTLKANDDGCRLSVYNDGNKIPDNQLDKIWAEFYTRTEKSKDNIGLGLFIVKEISVLNHSSCGAINRDRGVEFWFDFK